MSDDVPIRMPPAHQYRIDGFLLPEGGDIDIGSMPKSIAELIALRSKPRADDTVSAIRLRMIARHRLVFDE